MGSEMCIRDRDNCGDFRSSSGWPRDSDNGFDTTDDCCIMKSDGSTTQSSARISKIKNIKINSGDVFIHDQMISLCTDGEKCTKLADQGKCCKATCASISNINTFCNGLTPIAKTLLDSTFCVGISAALATSLFVIAIDMQMTMMRVSTNHADKSEYMVHTFYNCSGDFFPNFFSTACL